MKLFPKRLNLFFLLFVAYSSSFAQNNFWTSFSEAAFSGRQSQREIFPKKYKTLTLDTAGVKRLLGAVPKESTTAARNNSVVITLPMPDGSVSRFRIVETAMMEPGLAKEFSNIKTYGGQGIDDPYATIQLDWNELGFHGMIISPVNGTIFIDPYARGTKTQYISYNKADVSPKTPFIETVAELSDKGLKSKGAASRTLAGQCIGGTLRRYRLAIACTGEYARAAVGDTNATVAQALSAIVTTVNRVNGVYEREVDIRLVLVDSNKNIVFTNPATDPFNGNNNSSTLIDESQTQITNRIGVANFDIGHTFSTGGGGYAAVGVVCNSRQKASGITGSPSPVGDAYDIDYVAHEIGHQFGASHTFNAETGNCANNGSSAANAEPGSGVTIMSYAGICGSTNNLQANSIPYFHAVSFDEIVNFINNGAGNNCAVQIATGNTAPVVNAGNDYVIPKSTPFVLNGSANDPNGDALTYSWEQINVGGKFGNWNAPVGDDPLFRSFAPVNTGQRYFPTITNIINNSTTIGELLPSYARTLNFRLTARDNRTGGGGVCFDEIAVAVDANAGPFIVTSPNTAVIWSTGTFQTVTWDVAKTNLAPINCANVTIELSTDGGLTYPATLLASTPNDGTAEIIVPDNATTTARIRVRAAGNVFFDISNINFTIQKTTKPEFAISNPESRTLCENVGSSTVINTNGINGYATPITFTVTGNPAGSTVALSNNTVTPGAATTLTLSGTIPAGNYSLLVTAKADTIIRTTTVNYRIIGLAAAPVKISPANYSIGNVLSPTFTWRTAQNAASYSIQIATNASFTNIVQSVNNITDTFFTPTTPLQQNTEYYWRVNAVNSCGAGPTSAGFLFRTIAINCSDVITSTNVPVKIPRTASTITSDINIPTDGTIIDLDVIGLRGTHTYISDLTVSLTSPANTSVVLFNQICNAEQDFNISFDDQAASATIPCPPVGGVTRRPEQALSAFNNQKTAGTWRLNVVDNYADDSGFLSGWGLRICTFVVTPLKVTFTGRKLENNTVELTWVANGEANIDHYEIERSADGVNYSLIGNVKSANAPAGTPQQYLLIDNRPHEGINYYRLRQVTKDGNFIYADIVQVVVENVATKWVVYPNPAINNTTVRVLSEMKQLTLRMQNVLGQVVYQKNIGTAASGSQYNVPVLGLPKGVYIITMITDTGSLSQKLMVQ
jgi:subtilisin-like proprotein convertase family protein